MENAQKWCTISTLTTQNDKKSKIFGTLVTYTLSQVDCDDFYLSQEVILAHHIPVPDLQSDSSLLTQLLWVQLQLQSLSPVWEASPLDNLKPTI